MIRRLLLLPVLLAGVVLSAIPARADVSSNATIHWDTFSVTLIDLSGGLNVPGLTWISGDGYSDSYALTADPPVSVYDYDAALDLTTSFSTSASTAKAQSSTLRDSTIMSADAASQLGTSQWAPDWNYAYSETVNNGAFELTGHGIALIALDWDLSVFGNAADWDDYSYASASIYGYYSDGLFLSGSASSSSTIYSATVGDDTQSGTFSAAVLNPGLGTTVTTNLNAYSYAYAGSPNVVPEPSSCVLMGLGLGLVGWGSYRRRRK